MSTDNHTPEQLAAFARLHERLGGNENITHWHQHSNGLGWVHESANVDDTAYIGPDAIVWGTVSDNARISGNARVYGNARVSDNARIYGNARISGDAQTEQMIPIAPAPLNLGIDGFESWCGVVDLDDEGTLYECPMGARRAIVGPQNLTPIQRQQIANAMIARWTAFASGLSPLPR